MGIPGANAEGHIEPSSLKKPHIKACAAAAVKQFELYTFRHTCLTRWAPNMDPYTLAYLAGHADFATTKRYVHPQAEAVRAAVSHSRQTETLRNAKGSRWA
jgi:integrase